MLAFIYREGYGLSSFWPLVIRSVFFSSVIEGSELSYCDRIPWSVVWRS